MKKICSIYWMLTSICVFAFGQSNLPFEKAGLDNKTAGVFFAENLNYPVTLLSTKADANVVFSFIVSKEGRIDSVNFFHYPSQDAAMEILKVLEKSDGRWKSTRVNGQAEGWWYYGSVKFSTSSDYINQKKKIQKLVEKEKFEDALSLIDKGLRFHEYDIDLYQFRSSIYTKLNKTDLVESDLKKIAFIDQNLLIDVWVTAFGIPRRQ